MYHSCAIVSWKIISVDISSKLHMHHNRATGPWKIMLEEISKLMQMEIQTKHKSQHLRCRLYEKISLSSWRGNITRSVGQSWNWSAVKVAVTEMARSSSACPDGASSRSSQRWYVMKTGFERSSYIQAPRVDPATLEGTYCRLPLAVTGLLG